METKKDFWLKTFQDWETSGLKRTEFCQQNGLTVSTFDYWRIKVKKESEPVEEKSLVKLPVQFSSETAKIIIELPSKHKIHIPGNYDSELLKRLLFDLNEVSR